MNYFFLSYAVAIKNKARNGFRRMQELSQGRKCCAARGTKRTQGSGDAFYQGKQSVIFNIYVANVRKPSFIAQFSQNSKNGVGLYIELAHTRSVPLRMVPSVYTYLDRKNPLNGHQTDIFRSTGTHCGTAGNSGASPRSSWIFEPA